MTERVKRNLTAVAVGLMIAAAAVVWFNTMTVPEQSSEPAQLIVHPSMTCSFTWTDTDGDTIGTGCEVNR